MCKDLTLEVGDVVEFTGSDEPKTQLLMSVIAQCILPKVLSGCEVDVILISTNCKFNILVLLGVIEQKLKLSACNSDRTFLDSILDRFHLFEATSIGDCCMILKSLLNFPWVHDKTGSVVTIIDGIRTLSWENKICTNREPKLEDCLEMVKKFVEENESLAIFSNFPPAANDKQYCTKLWLRLVNYRFKLESEGVNVRIQQIFPDSRTFLLQHCPIPLCSDIGK